MPGPRVTKVWIEEGCIVCRACEVQCAEVFVVRDDGCIVATRKFTGLEDRIKQAADVCPVKVIEFTTAGATAAATAEPAPQRRVKKAAPGKRAARARKSGRQVRREGAGGGSAGCWASSLAWGFWASSRR